MPTTTARTDFAKLSAKFEKAEQSLPRARAAYTRYVGNVFASHVSRHAPRDTNRWVRAQNQAANQAGLGPYEVPELKVSDRYERFVDVIQNQLASAEGRLKQWRARERAYIAAGRTKEKYFRRIKREIRAAVKRFQSAEREHDRLMDAMAEDNKSLIFIAGRKRKRGGRGVARVLVEAAGGVGSFVNDADRSVVVLVNREPHARLVEFQHKVIAGGFVAVRGAGTRRIGKELIASVIREASGMKGGSGTSIAGQ